MMMPIRGYEGRYAVSEDGRVWSYRRGHWLKPSLKKGYPFVCLSNGPEIRQFTVHRLVAMAFIPNPDGLPQINHKNSDRQDNRVINLEWCTASYNKQHSWDNGTSVVTPAKRAASSRNAYRMHEANRRKHGN